MSEWREVSEPKIWVSRLWSDFEFIPMDTVTDGKNIDFIRASKSDDKLARHEDAPKFIAPDEKSASKIIKEDAFLIYGPFAVISPAMRDVLVQFDIGDTQLFEVPVFEKDRETPADVPNHYTLNVHAPKDTLIAELSENIEKPFFAPMTEPATW